MIISASRRTDIPAFYSDWFMNRIRAGYCEVPNPFNPSQISRVDLNPDAVDVIVFWTRNATPLLPHLDELDTRGYHYYFLATLTGYPQILESCLPPRTQLIENLQALSARVGPERAIWRYDPILLSALTDVAYHERNFAELAAALAGHTRRVILSLFDPYRKALRRLAQVPELGLRVPERPDEESAALFRDLAQTARDHDLQPTSCAETWDLRPYGIGPGACIDAAYIEDTFDITVTHAKDPGQRTNCLCVRSKDIGMYNTCRHGCLYCYATQSQTRTVHDPQAPSLLT
jgi:hypothetical protein